MASPSLQPLLDAARSLTPGGSLILALSRQRVAETQLATSLDKAARTSQPAAGANFFAQQTAQRASHAQAGIAQEQSRAAYFATPSGQASQRFAQYQQGALQTLQSQAASRDAQARAGFAASPAGQQQLQAQYGAGLRGQTASAQQQAAQAQAQAAYLKTPQGAQEYRNQFQAQQRQLLAQENLERQQNIAQFGKVEGGLKNFGSALGKLNPYVAAAEAAFATVAGWVGKASPNSAATLSGSADLLSAKLGTPLIPLVNAVSRDLQHLSIGVEKLSGGSGGWLQSTLKLFDRPAERAMNWTNGRGFTAQDDMARSMAGLPQPGIGTAQSYRDQMQIAALRTQGNSLEAQLLQEQVNNMKDLLPLVREIANNSRERGSAFR